MVNADRTALTQAERLLEVRRADDAVRVLTTYLAEHPDDPAALHRLARAHLLANRPQEALSAADAALAVDPGTAASWQRRCDALRGLGRIEEAVAAGRQCVELAPSSWPAHYSLGLALRQQPGHEQEVIAHAEAAVRLAPDTADPHVLLGLAYAGRGDRRAAEECYRQALAIDPDHAYARSNLSALRLRRGQYAEALRGFQAAASADPQQTLFHRNIAATVLSALVKVGSILAMIALLGSVIALALAQAGASGDGTGPDLAPAGDAWTLRIVLAAVVVLAWVALCVVKLAPLGRYLRGEVRRVLFTAVRSASFALVCAGCLCSQLLLLTALLAPNVTVSGATDLISLGVIAAVAGSLAGTIVRWISR